MRWEKREIWLGPWKLVRALNFYTRTQALCKCVYRLRRSDRCGSFCLAFYCDFVSCEIRDHHGRFYVGAGARGHLPPRFTCCPSDSKDSWPLRRDFWGPKMFQNPNFLGLRPGPRWGSLQRSPRPHNWWGGGSLPLPRTPPPLSALRASFLRVSGSNPLQSWPLYYW